MTDAIVQIPKLCRACLGVRRDTEARFAKWKGWALIPLPSDTAAPL